MGYEFLRYIDKAGAWRWSLRSIGNHEVIAASGESYYSLGNCDRAIALVKRIVPDAKLV